ncbi:hypothetical protein KKA14_20140 [bacterium]|nr:hypothetical protein [bacterium]
MIKKMLVVLVTMCIAFGSFATVYAVDSDSKFREECKKSAVKESIPANELEEYLSDCVSEMSSEDNQSSSDTEESQPADETEEDKEE